MKRPILIKTIDEKEIIVNEDQICTVEQVNQGTRITMSNGEIITCLLPEYSAWINDIHIRTT